LADGTFAHSFFADFHSPEFFSAAGVPGRRNSEVPTVFTATVPDR